MVNLWLIPKLKQNKENSLERNSLPLSLMIADGTPNEDIKCVRNAERTENDVLSVRDAATKKPDPLSRIVITYLDLLVDIGRGPIRSMWMVAKLCLN